MALRHNRQVGGDGLESTDVKAKRDNSDVCDRSTAWKKKNLKKKKKEVRRLAGDE